MSGGTNIVALRDAAGGGADPAGALARAAGLSAHEARARLYGTGPRVISVHADRAQAEAAVARLTAGGFDALVLFAEDQERDRVETANARSFELMPGAFRVQARDGHTVDLEYGAIRLMVRGLTIAQSLHTETTVVRKMSVPLALVSGGVMLTKKSERTTTTVEEERTLFLRLFTPGSPPVNVGETEVQYQGLGKALQPTRSGNFVALQRELRSRARGVAVDDRLATRAGQIQVLSELLPLQEYVEAAVSLVARAHGVR